MIDWTRMAEPQLDEYDTQYVLEHAEEVFKFEKKMPAIGEISWLDGHVRLGTIPVAPSYELPPARTDHPSIAQGEEFLRLWPAGYRQAQRLLNVVYPIDYIHAGPGTRGCFCGTPGTNRGDESSEDSPFGEVFSSVFDVIGFLEGVVHEMSHWKLHALGTHFEEWDDLLLLNQPKELYTSSIRKDKLRPMGAVLHAHYSYLHVLAIDLATIVARKAGSEFFSGDATNLRTNTDRAIEGRETIDKNAQWTSEGSGFWKGMEEWTQRMLNQSKSLIG